ncbi:MAG: RICIN domain-containing protein, partial [Oscillospiraceae bacterium]|nr:RICIN domain-containing protein [Oscillospiraceae bacterium]
MKNRTIRKGLRRAAALVLAVLSLVPAELLVPARAALSTTQTKLVVWDWIDDMQTIGKNGGADYDPANESKNIPVNQVKYSRIMFYQNTGGDRYFFNATDRGGSDSAWYSTYDEDKIYVNSSARVGNSSHKEWNSDMIAAEGGGSFLTKSGENTPYLQYGGTKEGFHTWRLWASTSGDNWSNHAVMLVDDYEDLDVRRTNGFSSNAASHYGAHNDPIRADCWIIGKTFVGAAAANTRYSFDNSVIWHWDNDVGGYNETMDFDRDDTKFKAFNAGTKIGVEEFKIFLGKEYKVSTLAENFEVYKDQTQTLGKPVFYVPKDRTITVRKHATLVIDGVLLLDGRIAVEEGGLLKLKDGAKVFPLTKYDVECGKIDSSGDIVIGTGAVLCGGANNGIRIGGGGVVNFGVLCGEYIELKKNDLVDNRVEAASQGWIIAGKSLTGAARSRFVKAAILNEDTAKLTVDRSKDFATLSSTTSIFSKQLYSVYGDGAANVDTSGVGKTTIGSASNPTLTVYVSDKPGEKGTALFKNEMLDEVTLRVSGAEAVYTVRDKVYDTISNKLISAEIGRGTDVQTLFKDMWVGELKNAYVQLEPASAAGTCLAIKDGSTANGANVQLGARDPNQTDEAQWWRLVEDGKSGLNRTYILQSFKDASKSLDLPGNNSAPNGANVQILTTAGDTGSDRRWLLVTDAMNRSYYRLRNAANTGVSLEADGTAAGVNVRVASNVESGQTVERQRWRFVNLFDEESYAASLKEAAAMELIPQNATGLRLQVSGMGNGVSTRVNTADSNNLAQRWELQQAGSDLL